MSSIQSEVTISASKTSLSAGVASCSSISRRLPTRFSAGHLFFPRTDLFRSGSRLNIKQATEFHCWHWSHGKSSVYNGTSILHHWSSSCCGQCHVFPKAPAHGKGAPHILSAWPHLLPLVRWILPIILWWSRIKSNHILKAVIQSNLILSNIILSYPRKNYHLGELNQQQLTNTHLSFTTQLLCHDITTTLYSHMNFVVPLHVIFNFQLLLDILPIKITAVCSTEGARQKFSIFWFATN